MPGGSECGRGLMRESQAEWRQSHRFMYLWAVQVCRVQKILIPVGVALFSLESEVHDDCSVEPCHLAIGLEVTDRCHEVLISQTAVTAGNSFETNCSPL